MSVSVRGAIVSVGLILYCGSGKAQTAAPRTTDVLVTTSFHTPLTYEQVIQRLDGYYDEQVGQKGAIAFPRIGPNEHFEVWHEMWAWFEPLGDGARVTLKKPADSASSRIAKGYMLDMAGWLSAELPLPFEEKPGLRTVETQICTSRKDLGKIATAYPAMRSLASWRHSGLLVSADPLMKVSLSESHSHADRQLTVSTVDLAGARSLLAKLQQAAAAPGICGVFSEEAELDAELRDAAQGRIDTVLNTATAPSLYHPQIDVKYIEGRLRGDPAMQKRIAAARGSYDVRFRVDRAYRKVTVRWSVGATDLGHASVSNVTKPAAGAAALTARVHLEPLKPGDFRVRLAGEGTDGLPVEIDERMFRFDGKIFEEPQDLGK